MRFRAEEGRDVMGVDEESIALVECFAGFLCDLSVGGDFEHPHQCPVCEGMTARQGFKVCVVLYWMGRDDEVEIDLVADLAGQGKESDLFLLIGRVDCGR